MNFSQLPASTHNNPAKYKTMLCKHFSSPKGCSFGEKCQFAHGMAELRSQGGNNPMMGGQMRPQQKRGPNPQNYKIVKCKYFERDGTCRYGTLCSFAHGDAELRKKSDNIMLQGGDMMMDQMPMYMPNMKSPYMGAPFDPSFMMPGMMPPMGNEGMMDMFMGMNMGTNMAGMPKVGKQPGVPEADTLNATDKEKEEDKNEEK